MSVQPPLDVEQIYDELRRSILKKLCETEKRTCGVHQYQVHQFRNIQELLPNRSIQERDTAQVHFLMCRVLHELYLERLIITGTANLDSTSIMEWPFFQVTEYGRQVFEESDYSPYDPDGYLRRLKEDIPDIDDTIIRYVEESMQCLRVNCLLAAAVTIGCASEKAMLMLIEGFGQAISGADKKAKYEKETQSRMISRKYKAFCKSLNKVDLPNTLRDSLEQQLHGIFDLIRQTRNEAGHPTGMPLTRETVFANQLLFPGYCKYVYSLMDHFAKHGVRL